jgi:hypothetical protein
MDGGSVALHGGAVVPDPASTIVALAAQLVGVHADPITYLHVTYVGANGCDLARKFVAEDGTSRAFGSALVTLEDMDVCSADTASMNLDLHLIGAGLRNRAILNTQIMFTVKNRSFHVSILLFLRCRYYIISHFRPASSVEQI